MPPLCRSRRVVPALALLVAVTASPALAYRRQAVATELIVNGGFEAPALADASWNVFTDIRGWRTSSGPGIEIQRGVAGAPLAGAQLVELDSHAASSMYQRVDTRAGAWYRLTYHVSPRPGTRSEDDVIEVRWNGAVVDRYMAETVGADTAWVTRTVDVQGASRESLLEFSDASPSNGVGAYLDEVSLVRLRS